MANIYEFSSDKIDIFLMVIDASGSMEDDEENVRAGIKEYKKSFEGFPEANSIAVSLCTFDSSFYDSDFKRIEDIRTNYESTGGQTALYHAICRGARKLEDYIEEVTKHTGCIPKATFILFSDGASCGSDSSEESAKDAVERLNLAGVTTVFVAFGRAINSQFGRYMNFMSTKDVNDRESVVRFLGQELSKSCKEQSQSLKALGANFFSQAIGNESSENYSTTTAQALEDDSWINDI